MTGLDPRRRLPGVDRLLEAEAVAPWVARWGREPVKEALREALHEARVRLAAAAAGPGDAGADTAPGSEALLARAREILRVADRPSLRRVLNGTGVVLHTNLGRAPLPEEATTAAELARGYSNLEYDLEAGRRGSRHVHCVGLLRSLSGAEAALVVNNNAAAVALAVNEMAAGREVVVSRGELVEIGGSFRLPDVVARAGGRLREVGTTNRTRLEDYRDAIGPETGLLMKVHPSNYRLSGFVASVPLADLVELGRERGIPVLHDLGSGLLRPELLPGFPPEPSVPESVASGADLVTWSGDKLLGGPQAGLVLGREAAVRRLRTNSLLRAFRVDTSTLAALEATLRLYRDPRVAADRVPALRMLREPVDSVEARARTAIAEVAAPEGSRVSVERTRAVVGGGAFPGFELDSAGWAVRGPSADEVEAACRAGRPPLLGRVSEGAFLVDVRTLLPGEEREAARALGAALRSLDGEGRSRSGAAGADPAGEGSDA